MMPRMAHEPNLIREINNYMWKEDQAGKDTNEPIDKFNYGITFDETASLSYLR